MFKIKFGIAAKVLAGMSLIVFAVIMSALLIVPTLGNFKQSFAEISNRKLPGLIGASQLIRETEQLTANAPDIITAKSQYILIRLAQDIEDKISRKDTLLHPLQEAGISSSDIRQLSDQFDLVFENLKILIDITTRRSETSYRSEQIFLRLYRISHNLNQIRMETKQKKLFNPWQNQIRQAIIDMLFSGRIDNKRDLEIVRKKINDLIGEIDDLHASDLGQAAASLQSEVIDYGTGEKNIFDLRQEQIALQIRIEKNLIENKFFSGELTKTANRIFSDIQTDIIRQNQNFNQGLRRIFLMSVSIPVFGILIIAVIYLYIRKSVIGRILILEKSMRDYVKGFSGPIPISGSDEITDMAKSVDYFISEINKREEKLSQAKDAAETANRAKSIFLANMSHELRTPLNAILGFSRMLDRSTNLDSKERKNLTIIRRSGEHLLNLINDILEISRIEAGHIEFSENYFDLYNLLDDIKNMFFLKARKKGLQLFFKCDAKVGRYFRTDEGKLKQILVNLVGNAVKFTEKGEIRVSVNSEQLAVNSEQAIQQSGDLKTDNCLLFTVKDTGQGIAPHEQTGLFDAFVQTETGRKTGEGTGLGLSISRKFVQMLGGDISVKSEVGKGSVFKFEIAVTPADSTDIKTAQSKRTVIALAPDQPEYRILIVDDIDSNRMLLSGLLAMPGFELREAKNGREAVEIWKKWNPHLIFMDIRMPVMDGYEATKKIRRTAKGQTAVIIAVTASVFEEKRAIVMSAGCDDFVCKPFEDEEIFNVMQRNLGVNFVYEDTQDGTKTENKANTAAMIRESLTALPPDLLTELQQAAADGDSEKLHRMISNIQPHHARLAEELTMLTDDFAFDTILDVIQKLLQED